jgi:hypothetical protein
MPKQGIVVEEVAPEALQPGAFSIGLNQNPNPEGVPMAPIDPPLTWAQQFRGRFPRFSNGFKAGMAVGSVAGGVSLSVLGGAQQAGGDAFSQLAFGLVSGMYCGGTLACLSGLESAFEEQFDPQRQAERQALVRSDASEVSKTSGRLTFKYENYGDIFAFNSSCGIKAGQTVLNTAFLSIQLGKEASRYTIGGVLGLVLGGLNAAIAHV